MKVDIDEIEHKLTLKFTRNSWGSFEAIWDMLYDIRMVKYVSREQISQIKKRYDKTCSLKKINHLIELGLLKQTPNKVLITTDYSVDLLGQLGKNVSILPTEIKGDGAINELNNTEVFIQALKLPDFIALLYPRFPKNNPYLIPDALLVRGTKERYKLEFLEVEAGKSNWDSYLEKKRNNYKILANEKRPYTYWTWQCKLLNLPVPKIEDFKFSVSIVGKIINDFGTGFIFMEKINGSI